MKFLPIFWKWLPVIALTATAATSAWTKDAINVYGPGGPAPAMQEAAMPFGGANVVTVNVTAGPTAQCLDQAKQDAWLTWNIWQVAHPELAQVVKMDEPFRIYRDAGVVLTRKSNATPLAKEFTKFLLSPAGAKIFAKWGWDAR